MLPSPARLLDACYAIWNTDNAPDRRLLLLKAPAIAPQTCSVDPANIDTLVFAAPHGFVEGEIIKLAATTLPANLPVVRVHPYYWVVAVTATTCKISADRPDPLYAIGDLGTGGVGISARSIDLGDEPLAMAINPANPGDKNTHHSPTLIKNEVFWANPPQQQRLKIQSISPARVIVPPGWPTSGKLLARFLTNTTQLTLANTGIDPITYRHTAIITGPLQGGEVSDVIMMPGTVDTVIDPNTSRLFEVVLGVLQG
jgi:hypothetical protein